LSSRGGTLEGTVTGKALHDDGSSKGLAPENLPDEPDEILFEIIRRFKGMDREVVVLVELPVSGVPITARASPTPRASNAR
jgi:hypothetical protein